MEMDDGGWAWGLEFMASKKLSQPPLDSLVVDFQFSFIRLMWTQSTRSVLILNYMYLLKIFQIGNLGCVSKCGGIKLELKPKPP